MPKPEPRPLRPPSGSRRGEPYIEDQDHGQDADENWSDTQYSAGGATDGRSTSRLPRRPLRLSDRQAEMPQQSRRRDHQDDNIYAGSSFFAGGLAVPFNPSSLQPPLHPRPSVPYSTRPYMGTYTEGPQPPNLYTPGPYLPNVYSHPSPFPPKNYPPGPCSPNPPFAPERHFGPSSDYAPDLRPQAPVDGYYDHIASELEEAKRKLKEERQKTRQLEMEKRQEAAKRKRQRQRERQERELFQRKMVQTVQELDKQRQRDVIESATRPEPAGRGQREDILGGIEGLMLGHQAQNNRRPQEEWRNKDALLVGLGGFFEDKRRQDEGSYEGSVRSTQDGRNGSRLGVARGNVFQPAEDRDLKDLVENTVIDVLRRMGMDGGDMRERESTPATTGYSDGSTPGPGPVDRCPLLAALQTHNYASSEGYPVGESQRRSQHLQTDPYTQKGFGIASSYTARSHTSDDGPPTIADNIHRETLRNREPRGSMSTEGMPHEDDPASRQYDRRRPRDRD
ncbi:hypothetical protein DL770_010385 [Monosporascus sp. CRB-9-2]|nr:hypothetical protein DL770_010385 [Monosporascus sp. CRB-9-2]